jgi:hypothetical protein
MCLGAPSPPPPPPRMKPAPPMKSAAPPPEIPQATRLEDEGTEEDKVSTRKRKALEIKQAQRGVKEFSAIDPASMPNTGNATPTGITKPNK